VAARRSTPRFAEALDLFEGTAPASAAAGMDGHRRRLRERLLSVGPEALADHEMLELVLFALPRRDTRRSPARCWRSSAASPG
jgi:DNA repair protein RadC